jgi:predicted Rossmann-fold nucleotide-binding protein
VAGYYDPLFAFLEHAIAERFVKEEYRPMMIMEDDPGRLIDRFAAYRAPKVRKWIDAEET